MALTAVDFDKLIPDKIDMVVGVDKTTGELMFMFDEIKDANLENGSNKIFGTGSGGSRIFALNRDKSAKFSCNNGFLIASAIGAQTGSGVVTASESEKLTVPTIEIVTVGTTTTSITLAQTPVGVTGAEIPFIYKANKDGTQGEKYAISATASATEFALDKTTKTITLPTGKFDTGDRVIVIYSYETAVGKMLANSGDKYALDVKLYFDILCRDVCDNKIVYHTRFEMPNASIDGNFNLDFGSDPSVHAFSAESLQETCGGKSDFWRWYIVE